MRKLTCTDTGCKLEKKNMSSSGIGQEVESYTIPIRNDHNINSVPQKRKRRRTPKVNSAPAKKRRKVQKSVSRRPKFPVQRRKVVSKPRGRPKKPAVGRKRKQKKK